MPLDFCVLGSGSGGNSTLVRTAGGSLLIDAGFGPRTTAARLAAAGAALGEVSAVCLTHMDRDHFNPTWMATLVRQGIRVHCHARCAQQILGLISEPMFADGARRIDLTPLRKQLVPFDDGLFEPLAGVSVQPIAFAHDEAGSHGFLIQTARHRIGFATDLGHVPDSLIPLFAAVDLLAIESNYDVDMEVNSSRPEFLKQRIMGGAGHLSNAQAYEAIRAILDRAQTEYKRLPRHIVLLHPSRQCNSPRLLKKLFESDPRIKRALTLTSQTTPTRWLRLRAGTEGGPLTGAQTGMGWGEECSK